jgi:hypothetical protein
MILEKTGENMIEARLRRPDGVPANAITPEFIANIRAAMRAETARPAPTPSPAKKAPAKKK